MGALLFLLAIVSMGIGGSQYAAVQRQIEPWIAPPTEYSYGTAVDTVIWNSWVPVSVRRQYMCSLAFMPICFALIAGGIWDYGDRGPAMLFAGLALLCAVLTLHKCVKNRSLLAYSAEKVDQ